MKPEYENKSINQLIEEILEEGINDGTYADILDVINVDTKTPFFKAVCQFARDCASQRELPSDEEIIKWAESWKPILLEQGYSHSTIDFILRGRIFGAKAMRDGKITK